MSDVNNCLYQVLEYLWLAYRHLYNVSKCLFPTISTPILSNYKYLKSLRERSGSVVECLTRDRGAAGLSLVSVTALWSLSKTRLSQLSTGSTKGDSSLFN